VQPRLALLVVGVAVIFIVFVVAAVRARRMSEPIAVFWILLFVALGAFSLLASRRLIDRVAEVLGVIYAPSLYLLLGIVVAFGVLLYFSIQLSTLGRLVRGLVQEVAILTREVESLREDRPAPREER
jgi:hypothetical protein